MNAEAQDLSLAIYVALICVGASRWFVGLAVRSVALAWYERQLAKRKGSGK